MTDMTMIVGYRLLDEAGAIVQSWGGTYGQCPRIPPEIILPNGDCVHSPSIGELLGEHWTLAIWQSGPDAAWARARRDALLRESDWRAMPDVFARLGSDHQAAVSTYRQALRDLPLQPGFPGDIAWPALTLG